MHWGLMFGFLHVHFLVACAMRLVIRKNTPQIIRTKGELCTRKYGEG
jgi:hypothetical protein